MKQLNVFAHCKFPRQTVIEVRLKAALTSSHGNDFVHPWSVQFVEDVFQGNEQQ